MGDLTLYTKDTNLITLKQHLRNINLILESQTIELQSYNNVKFNIVILIIS